MMQNTVSSNLCFPGQVPRVCIYTVILFTRLGHVRSTLHLLSLPIAATARTCPRDWAICKKLSASFMREAINTVSCFSAVNFNFKSFKRFKLKRNASFCFWPLLVDLSKAWFFLIQLKRSKSKEFVCYLKL